MPTALERLRALRREVPAPDVSGQEAPPETAARAAPRLPCAVSAISAVSPPPGYSGPVADVLALVTNADAPVPHPALLRGLMERGWAKDKARAAVADCQKRGWIEHDLLLGYVLAGAATIDDREEKHDGHE